MLLPQRDETTIDTSGLLSSIDISQIPVDPPPPGAVSNFVNPESIGGIGRVIICSTWPLMIVFLSLRIYARSRITRSIGADDFLDNPLGPQPWDVRLISLTPRVFDFLLVLICVYCVASIFLKSSLLAFYLRIFRPKRVPRITIWVSLWLIIIFYLTLAIYSPAVCHSWGTSLPSSGDSDVSGLLPVPNITQIVEEGSPDAIQEAINLITQSVVAAADVTPCKRTQLDVSVAGGIFSAVTDIYFLLLPVWLIADLRLPVKRKIGICAVFLIGVLACVCSVTGAYIRVLSLRLNDTTRLFGLTLPLAVAEVNVGIICGCVPVLPVIYKRIKGGTVWIYLSKLIPTIWRRNAESNLESSPEIPSSSTITKRDWVKIPTANLTGLRSFIWKSHRTLPGQVTELSTYAEISSANDEYHTHIRVGDSGGVSNKKDRNLGFHA
ncbi:hypothetical protein GGS26DRAFT_65829 [Hypomontagnella submonticulosa]|nr:hypothetical protein GGS26DRAFT_65829 [Hypomontagnella submonticulosa]